MARLHYRSGRGRRAGWRSSGPACTPDDIDVCELYDAFTYMLLITLEDLGFCAKGEGGPFVEDGRLRSAAPCRPTPTAADCRACHPGMRGLFLIVEAVSSCEANAAPARSPTPRWRA